MTTLEARVIVQNGKPVTVDNLQVQLRDLRLAADMSQYDAAAALCEAGVQCSQRAISCWENETRAIDWRVMVALLRIYGREVVVR